MNSALKYVSADVFEAGQSLAEQAKNAVFDSVDASSEWLLYWPKQALNIILLAAFGLVGLLIFSLLFTAYALACIAMTTLQSMKMHMGVNPEYDPFQELTDSIRDVLGEASTSVPVSEPTQGAAIAVRRPAVVAAFAVKSPDVGYEPTPLAIPAQGVSREVPEPVVIEEVAAEPVPKIPADAEPVTTPKKPGKSSKRYTDEDLEKAVQAVLSGQSMRSAAKEFGVPFSTLNGALKKHRAASV